MALTFIGPPDTFYAKVTVGGNFQTTLQPVPGETYHIDDPGDGLWVQEGEKVQKADKGPVVADTTKKAESGSTEAEEGN